MIIKFSSTDDFKSDVAPVAIVTDNKQLSKRAGSDRFKHVKVPKHQTPVHLLAVGSLEGTGHNRNGDFWLEEDCTQGHHTFVKSGRVHENHRNKPNDPIDGTVHSSDYNEKMKRIELFIGLDTNNPRNKKALDLLHSGKQQAFSMGCKVSHDLCSICGHKSYTGKDRCIHIPKQLGEITKEGKMVGMRNPNPDFFEISKVLRPADRCAYSLNSFKKTASENNDIQERYIYNQKQAQEIYIPESQILISKYASSKRSMAIKLSQLEKHVDAIANGKITDSRDKYIKEQASKLNSAPQLSEKTISELRSFEDHTKLLKAMADKGVLFTPEEFYKYVFNNQDVGALEDMKSHLPSIHEELLSNDDELNNDDFNPEEGKIPQAVLELVKSLTNDHSINKEYGHGRIMRITIIKSTPVPLKKESSVKSDSLFGKQLALKYANYQLSTLSYLNENNLLDDETMINSLVLNRR